MIFSEENGYTRRMVIIAGLLDSRGQLALKAITKELGVRRQNVFETLQRMIAYGDVVKIRQGVYALTKKNL